jgi:LacI family repressor for deo operon, udp, cdd, tsx, nupC, and nupG
MIILDLLHIIRNSSVPIANQLFEQISWLITTREIQDGEHLPPIRSAANALGIHMHTVRSSYHLLEQRGLVSTRPGQGTVVLPYVSFTHTVVEPNHSSHLIGLMIPDFSPFYAEFLNGAEQAAKEKHCFVVVLKIGENPGQAEKYLDLLIAKNTGGVIIASPGFSNAFQKKMDDGEIILPFPIVYADVPNLSHSAVQLDSAGAATQAAVHLVDHGHSSIGLINAPQEWPLGNEIYTGFQEGLRARGGGTGQLFIRTVTEFSIEAGYQAGLMLINSALKPTAVFAVSDNLAIGAMRAFKDRGFKVPEDMAVVGYSNMEIASLVEPALTSISAPVYELGIQSAGMLLRLISSRQKFCENIILPTKLVIRRSCGCSINELIS